MPLIKYWRPDGFDPVDLSIPEHHKKKTFLRPTRKWTVTRDFGDDIPDLHDDGGGIGILAYNEDWVGYRILRVMVPSTFAGISRPIQ